MLLFIPPLATLFSPTMIIALLLIGLLLYGKELPMIARNAVKQYYRYKRMINDATADLRREMDSVADHLEEEKRKLQDSIQKEIDETKNTLSDEQKPDENKNADEPTVDNSYSNGSTPPAPYDHTPGEVPPKPAADPLSLDVSSPGTLSHRATEPVKSAADRVAKLDSIQKNVPPPSKIPPPL